MPLTVGTAGHVDHGKTALVKVLTGVDTDRLPEERKRGISIVLGYAALGLPSGRRLSLVDVPGHERFVRTMVAGASGIDFFLMTVAADDGVMPQTREHATVLQALGVEHGVVAVTKADLRDPAAVLADVAKLLPGVPSVAVSSRTGVGIVDLRRSLDDVAEHVPARATAGGAPLLHIDRVFTIRGAGTVVTGTLVAGVIGRGETLVLLPAGRAVRVRGVQVHDLAVDRAEPGQRVAVNLNGIDLDEIHRGDVLAGAERELTGAVVLDVASEVELHRVRVQVHHGTRETAARGRRLDDGRYRLQLERPLMAAVGDRLVLRAIAPPSTLGGAIVGATYDDVDRVPWRRPRAAAEAPAPASAQLPPAPEVAPLSADALALEDRLRRAGHEPPLNSELDEGLLTELREAGRAVRAGRSLHYHPEALATIETRVRAILDAEGAVTLARLRDELQTSRKFAQALLEHFDAAKVTRRRPDDARVLLRRRRPETKP